jgi:hypothetical protein
VILAVRHGNLQLGDYPDRLSVTIEGRAQDRNDLLAELNFVLKRSRQSG